MSVCHSYLQECSKVLESVECTARNSGELKGMPALKQTSAKAKISGLSTEMHDR